MSVAVAFFRASVLNAASYKLNTVMSYFAVLIGIVPLYFVSGALQPIMGNAIADQGGQYFGFLLVGITAFYLVPYAVTALPTAVSTSITTGTLETVFSTPARLPSVLIGMVAYQLVFLLVRVALTLGVGKALGAPIFLSSLPASVVVLALIVASHLPFALLGAAMFVRFRTTGPVLTAVTAGSSLLGGVYYPTHVMPSWLSDVAEFIPLTYGLRALRQVMLRDASLFAVSRDVVMLTGMTLVLLAVGVVVFDLAMRHARRHGTLGMY